MSNFRKYITIPIIIWLFLTSCSTNQILVKSIPDKASFSSGFVVIKNDSSLHFPVGIYPNHESISAWSGKKVAAHIRIDSLICIELNKKGYECNIIERGTLTPENVYTILYQDYWAWDFKDFMHILKIWVYYNNKETIKVVSQGNTAGMHDYPMPEDQVPKLVELILQQAKKE